MRPFLACLLLTLVPFTGVRVVCTDGTGAVAASLAEAASPDCEAFCLRRNAPAQSAPAALADCLLVADGSLLLVMSGVAVLPAPPVLPIDPATIRIEPTVGEIYLAPVLVHRSPPPKA